MQELRAKIIAERDRRIADGEDRDPVCVLADQLAAGQPVTEDVIALIWEAHQQGPWRIHTTDELKTFGRYCAAAGFPIDLRLPSEVVCRIPIYRDDIGDCVFSESAAGQSVAVWTRKGRIQVGFEFQEMAEKFRALRPEYSMKATENRHVGMVVLENADNPEMIYQVCCDLMQAKS